MPPGARSRASSIRNWAREILESVEFQYSIANFRGSGWLDDAIDQVNRQRAEIVRCVNAREKDLEDVTQTLGAEFMENLTSKEDKSPEESAVAMQISQLRGVIAECKILLEKTNRLLTRLSELEGRLKREQLNQRDTSLVYNLTHGLSELGAYNRDRLNVLVSILSGTPAERAGALLGDIAGRRAGWLADQPPGESAVVDAGSAPVLPDRQRVRLSGAEAPLPLSSPPVSCWAISGPRKNRGFCNHPTPGCCPCCSDTC